MSDTKQIIDTICSSSDYSLQDCLDDLGRSVPNSQEAVPVAQRLLTTKGTHGCLQVPGLGMED